MAGKNEVFIRRVNAPPPVHQQGFGQAFSEASVLLGLTSASTTLRWILTVKFSKSTSPQCKPSTAKPAGPDRRRSAPLSCTQLNGYLILPYVGQVFLLQREPTNLVTGEWRLETVCGLSAESGHQLVASGRSRPHRPRCAPALATGSALCASSVCRRSDRWRRRFQLL
jgi:hypothetical protein